jgi:hypothetical protein
LGTPNWSASSFARRAASLLLQGLIWRDTIDGERRRDPKQDRGGGGDANREREHTPVERHVKIHAVANARELRDEGLIVTGGSALRGGKVHSHWDHRIAMALAIAGLAADGPTEIEGWGAVATSYPGFEHDLERLCGS